MSLNNKINDLQKKALICISLYDLQNDFSNRYRSFQYWCLYTGLIKCMFKFFVDKVLLFHLLFFNCRRFFDLLVLISKVQKTKIFKYLLPISSWKDIVEKQISFSNFQRPRCSFIQIDNLDTSISKHVFGFLPLKTTILLVKPKKTTCKAQENYL